MEPNNISDIQVQGSLGGQKVGMTFDESSLAHLMSVLTDLYSDKEMAVLREYSTNALDAHVEAGVKKPIEVSLPTILSPMLRIKDHGVGLSVDDIMNIYSKYGASTKRETNDQVGMLGLGCKSALTYTQTFTLTSVKNGVKVLASISRIEDGTGSIEIVDTSSTDEGNGTEIVIPVQRYNDFANKAKRFFRFWAKDTVLVNGVDPYDRDEWTEVAPNVYTVPGLSQDYVVMGNVGYPVTDARLWEFGYNTGVVAYVPIGTINFTPSREQLHYTKNTQATVDGIRKLVKDTFKAAVEKEISSASNHAEAMTIYTKWYNELDWRSRQVILDGINYKGEKFPSQFKGPVAHYSKTRTPYINNRSESSFSELNGAVLIKDFDAVVITRTHRQKIDKWREDNDITGGKVYIMNEPVGSPWTDDMTWYSWNDIKDIRLSDPKARVPRAQRDPGYDVWDKDKGFKIVKDIPTDAEIVYFSGTEGKRDGYPVRAGDLHDLFPSATIVRLGKNRWEKFCREHPNAQHYRKLVEPLRNGIWDALTDDDKCWLENHSHPWFKNMDATKIDDPEFKVAIELVNRPEPENYRKAQARYYTLRAMGIYGDRQPDTSSFQYNFEEKYPLAKTAISAYYYDNARAKKMPHIYAYINMIHKEGL